MFHKGATGDTWVYLSGRILRLDEAWISPLDRGFLYGDGVFTTLRVESGRPLYLNEHLARLTDSLTKLRISLADFREIDWQHVLSELLQRNHMQVGPGAVKIIVTRGIAAPLGLPETQCPTLFIQTRSYQPPSPEEYAQGWRLQVYRHGHAPPLAHHKSLNYLYHLAARQAALDAGADEAVILDAHGQITETAAGSLLVRSQGGWWTLHSPYQLPGVTLSQVRRLLEERGQSVEFRNAAPDDLAAADTIWVLNSLLGIMPARSVDGVEMPDLAAEEANDLREELFGR